MQFVLVVAGQNFDPSTAGQEYKPAATFIQRAHSRLGKKQTSLECMLVMVIPLLVYLATLARTVYTFDSGELTVAAYTLGLVHAPGYPLYLLLAKGATFIPIGSVAYRINLMSAVFASLAVAEIYWIVVQLTASKWGALAASWLLAASPVYWSQAVVASTYPLHIFLMMSMLTIIWLWFTTKNTRWMNVLALLFGLSLCNHISTALLMPGIILLLCLRWDQMQVRLRDLGTAVILFGLGCAVYLYLPIRYLADTNNYVREYFGVDLSTWQGLWWMVSGEMFRPEMFGYSLGQVPNELYKYIAQLWINTWGIGLIAGLVGLWQSFKKGGYLGLVTLLTSLWFCAYVAFYINYRVVNKQMMFVFSYAVAAIPMGIGFSCVEELLIRLACRGARESAPLIKKMVGPALLIPVLVAVLVNLPVRDQSRRSDIVDYARTVFECTPPNALILAGWLSAGPLQYYQIVEGQRPDVTIFNTSFYALGVRDQAYRAGQGSSSAAIIQDKFQQRVEAALDSGPVYILEPSEYGFSELAIAGEGPCYRIVRKP